jgi:hypothetical protein
LIVKALKEPPRDRKKVKNSKFYEKLHAIFGFLNFCCTS